ncbi:MAG: hypothetical protein JNIBNLAF_01167 [Nitrosomonas europaea]|nr:hypothetical protein [Nitrosomonas europaea]
MIISYRTDVSSHTTPRQPLCDKMIMIISCLSILAGNDDDLFTHQLFIPLHLPPLLIQETILD